MTSRQLDNSGGSVTPDDSSNSTSDNSQSKDLPRLNTSVKSILSPPLTQAEDLSNEGATPEATALNKKSTPTGPGNNSTDKTETAIEKGGAPITEAPKYPWLSWIKTPENTPSDLSLPLPVTGSPAETLASLSENNNVPETEAPASANDPNKAPATGWKRVTSWMRGGSGSGAGTDNPQNPDEVVEPSENVPELSDSFRPPVVLVTNRRGTIRWEMTPHTESYPRYAYETNTYAFTGDRARASQSLESGLAAASQQDLPLAMNHFGEAVYLDPSYFEALFNLAITARKLERNWIAMRAFESSLWVRPEHEPTRMQFAALLYQNNYLIDAAQEWETVLRENPDQVQAHFLMGRLLDLDFRRPDLAKPHYKKVIQLEPNHPQAENIRTWLAWFP